MLAVAHWAATLLLLTSCGRIDFDAQASPMDGGSEDAAMDTPVVDSAGDAADAAEPPPPAWVTAMGDPAAQNVGTDVAADSMGNVYATVRLEGTVTVGEETFVSNGGQDILVVAYFRDGGVRWARQIGGTLNDSSWSLAVGPDDNVYVGASVRDEVDLGTGPMTGGGSGDNAVLSYDAEGGLRWAIRVADGGFGSAGDIGFDAGGNVYFAGTFFGTADFGGGPVSSSSADGYDGKIWGLTADGVHRFFAHWGTTGTSATRGVAVDAAGNLYFAMLLDGTVDIGGGELASPMGNSEVVFASIDGAGAHRWSFAGGGNGGLGQNVAVDADDNVYFTGNFSGTIDLGGLAATSAGCNDGLLASFAADGSPRWIAPLDSSGCDITREAKVDDDGTIYMTGTVGGPVDLGGGMLPHAGGEDIVVARFTADGEHLWSTTLGGPGDDDAHGLALGPDGDIVLAGSFSGPVDFGDGVVTPASTDAYVLRLNPGLAGAGE